MTESFVEQYPEAQIGIIVARGLDNKNQHPELTAKLRASEEAVRAQHAGIVVSQHPQIVPWREAYRQFGAKPKKYPSSIENLLKRVLKGTELRPINPLVDLYNVVSLNHVLPVGGEDLAQISGDIRLTIAGDDEPAVKLLGDGEARPPYPREVIYTDDIGAICRRWNWKEADRTKLTENTTDAILVLEIIPPLTIDMLQAAMNDIIELIQQYCGDQVITESTVINANNRTLDL